MILREEKVEEEVRLMLYEWKNMQLVSLLQAWTQ